MKLLAAFSKTAFMAILLAVAIGVNAVGAVAVTVTGACLMGVAYAASGKQLRFGGAQGILRADIVTSELVAEFGAYYLNQKQNMTHLVQMLRMKTFTNEVAQFVMTEDSDSYKNASSHLSSVLQAFQKKFTPKGTAEFKPRTIPLHRMKVDTEFWPDDIYGTWVGFLADYGRDNKVSEGQARKDWPFIRYILEKDLIPQLHDDLERKAYYKGVRVAPTENVAGTAEGAMDGIQKWLTDGLASHGGDGSIVQLDDWAGVTASNIFDKAEAAIDRLDYELEGEKLVMAMSPKNVRAYLRDKRNTHGADQNYDPKKLTLDFYENCKIVGLPSMSGTDDLWVTPEKNFKYVRRTKMERGSKVINVEESKRQVFLMTDWTEGLGFTLNELLFAYVTPQTSGSASAS